MIPNGRRLKQKRPYGVINVVSLERAQFAKTLNWHPILKRFSRFQFELTLALQMGGCDIPCTHFGSTWLDPHIF